MEKCKLCDREFKSILSLTSHLASHNITSKEYYDKFLRQPQEGTCAVCNNNTQFVSLTNGYKKFCSKKCAKHSPETQRKYEQTCLERYGTTSVLNTETAKRNREKTNLSKYGSTSPFGNKEIKDKIKHQNLKKFGAEYPLQNKEILSKTKETLLQTYGVSNPSESDILVQKRLDTLESKRKQYEINHKLHRLSEVVYNYGQGWYYRRDLLDIHPIYHHGIVYISEEDVMKAKQHYEKTGWGHKSFLEKDVHDYLLSIYKGELIVNRKNILPSGLELDFYFPELKIAIEVNGTYFHSQEAGTKKTYHLNKSKECEKLGIRLIHIYEYEWLDYPDKIKMMLMEALGYSNRIYARNCDIRQISNKEARSLNEKVHLQGHRNAKITYGLFYKDELVQLMSFSNSKYNKNIAGEHEWEIIRGCPGSNTSVVGGVSKLLSHFIKDYQPQRIISYCDFNKYNGKSYEAVGMKFLRYTGPDKKIIYRGKVINRDPGNYEKYKNENTIYGAGSKLYEWRAT